MACHAIVTRLEQLENEKILVGVHFYKLEMSHRINLARGLVEKFGFDRSEDDQVIDLHLEKKKRKIIKVFALLCLWIVLTTLLFALFFGFKDF
jgi:hypothetical protein